MKALVTGAAGFIGSSLAEALLRDKHVVLGVDSFTPHYEEWRKRANIASLSGYDGFTFQQRDLCIDTVEDLVDGADVIFHIAGQPGVRSSWGDAFNRHVESNLVSTQRLLDVLRDKPVQRFVLASSSSVYGEGDRPLPCSETDPTIPTSPYGVSKLAAEGLCSAYAQSWGIPTVSLRYFTVYGPRQRPDMAIHKLIEAARLGEPFSLYGDGSALRDFTFVDDVVAATIAAAHTETSPLLNVAGHTPVSVLELIAACEEATGLPIEVRMVEHQPGDVRTTDGDGARAGRELGWKPQVSLKEGLRRQYEWQAALTHPG